MFRYFRIYILNLMLHINVAELYSKDNNTSNINHLYDDRTLKVIVNRINHNTIVNKAEKGIEHTTPYATHTVGWGKEEILLQNMLLKLTRENEEHICLLDSITTALRWWSHSNGTLRETNINMFKQKQQLDLSYRNISNDAEALTFISNISQNMETVVFSLAYNNLNNAPFQTLEIMKNSLKYLSLMGNKFIDFKSKIRKRNSPNCSLRQQIFKICTKNYAAKMHNNNEEGLQWATFPYMPSLLELDISDCSIEFINKMSFQNLTNLKSLYMSSNKMLTIPSHTFYHTRSLQVLDLSLTNADFGSVSKFTYGVNIEQHVFRYIPNLVYLNLSHSKLRGVSALAFTYLGPNLKYLSLCYTSFPVFSNLIFRSSPIIGLDLSGNANAVFSITEDVFEDLSETLAYLIFEKANLRDLSWIKPLHNLRLLALAGNNINTLSAEHFSGLNELHVLDLTSNQVGNWYSRVFMHNRNLRLLSLSDNNINIITSEMFKDFKMLAYLSLGNNNFICDCKLRELLDIAAVNNQQAKCSGHFWQDHIHINSTQLAHIWQNTKLFVNTSLSSLDIPSLVIFQNLQKLKQVVKKLVRNSSEFSTKPKIRFILNALKSYNISKFCLHQYNSSTSINRVNSLPIKLQLLDYGEEEYWCYNETKRQHVISLNCQRATLVEDIEQKFNRLITCVMAGLGSLILVVILGVLIYFKRWHIYYYYSSLKSAALFSVVSKANLKKFNTLSDQNPHMLYDIFISYCQSDRDWIVKEFMPNVEDSGDISICLHERDFQVGITILDNIVSCMERSKVLMLVISSNFLLSHWCQFEMQLAQYHVLDLSKEYLILILLEDIPRSKRPKNLQFLMDVNTYIKWPGDKNKGNVHPEERKLFWKRLNRTLGNTGLTPSEFQA